MVQQQTAKAPKVVRVIEPTISVQETVNSTYRAIRVAAYCRVSTKQEEQLNSYENQVKHYTERINAEPGWILEGSIKFHNLQYHHRKEGFCKKSKLIL